MDVFLWMVSKIKKYFPCGSLSFFKPHGFFPNLSSSLIFKNSKSGVFFLFLFSLSVNNRCRIWRFGYHEDREYSRNWGAHQFSGNLYNSINVLGGLVRSSILFL